MQVVLDIPTPPGYPRPQVAILQANLPPGPWPVRTWQDFKWGYRQGSLGE
ncbi:MAG TPA: hypothetical protein VGO93_00645 [Candidatus Xenobia bacterium]